MSSVTAQDLTERRLGATVRRDAWWIQPLVTATVLGAFGIYSTWAAWVGEHFEWGPYLSPFYSPLLQFDWWPLSPAFLILGVPLGFRATCYYYRKAYYRAFFFDPVACAVGEPRTGYLGERSFPLILQNVHRYFLYIAVIFLVILTYDAYKAFWFTDSLTGARRFGIGLGSLVMVANVVALTLYTFGCHSMRHVVGGVIDRLSQSPVRKVAYDCSSCLNRAHMQWAWTSLVAVGFTDVYIRLCAMGIWTDWRIL